MFGCEGLKRNPSPVGTSQHHVLDEMISPRWKARPPRLNLYLPAAQSFSKYLTADLPCAAPGQAPEISPWWNLDSKGGTIYNKNNKQAVTQISDCPCGKRKGEGDECGGRACQS